MGMFHFLVSMIFDKNHSFRSSVGDDAALVEGGLVAIDIKVGLSSLIDWHIISGVMSDVVLSWSHNLVFGVIKELVPVGQPSNNSGNHEKNGEHVGRESHGLVDDATVEVNVGVQLSLDEVGIRKSDSLQFNCDFNQLLFSGNFEDLLSDLFDDLGTRVIVLVDSVAETIEKSLLVLNVFNELRDVGLLANSLQHAQNCLVGTSVLTTIKSSSCSSNSGVNIDSRGRQVSDGCSRAVEFVLSVENEENLKCFHEFGMRLELSLIELIKHEEEVLNISCVFMRFIIFSSDPVTVSIGSDSRNTSKQTINLFVSDLLVLVDSLANKRRVLFWMQGRKSSDSRAKHSHGMSIISEMVHHSKQIFVDEGMLHDLSGEGVEFLLGWQFSPEDKICDLHEGALLSEYLDGISSILKDSSISINERDSGGTGDGVHVSWIICSEHLSLVGELGEIS